MSASGPSHRLALQVALLTLIVAMGLVTCCALVAIDGLQERVEKADAIVVLASLVKKHDVPSARLVARLQRGLDLWRAGVAPVVVVSGGVTREGIDEAAEMRAWLLKQGVPDSAIVTDPAGRNTWATAAFVKRWLDQRGGSRVVAVSQYFHLTRTRLALRRHGVAWVGSSPARILEWRDLYSLPRDTWGLFVYAFRPVPGKERS